MPEEASAIILSAIAAEVIILVSLSTNDSAEVCTAVRLTLSTPSVVIPVTLPASIATVPSKSILLPEAGSNFICPSASRVKS